MVVDFSKVDVRERPVLILKNLSGIPIGVLGNSSAVVADIKYNEVSTLEFNLPAYVDGIKTEKYDSVVGMKIVDLQNVGQFILMNPKENGDGVKQIKSCKGYSLEYEFTFKKLTLQNGTYEFWNAQTPDSTILGIIMDLMPSWSVGSVDKELVGKYRTFEVSDENLYNFIKNTLQISYNCVFDFDTYNRKVNVKSASSSVTTNPVFISFGNLAKEIEVEEDTESIVTRLDVNGAEGVDIRDVNPTGNNKIINLDYYMNTDNFSQNIINKYNNWKTTYQNQQLPYYNLSIEYSLQVMRRATESAALTELQGELSSLENQQAVVIRAIAQNLQEQSDLDSINVQIVAKENEIKEKQSEIDTISEYLQSILGQLAEINKETDIQSYFTADEYKIIDRYIKDDAVSESSFVAESVETYSDDYGGKLTNASLAITESNIVSTSSNSKALYSISSGQLTINDELSATIISGVLEKNTDNSFVMSLYLSDGAIGETAFKKACVSLTGTCGSPSVSGTSLSVVFTSAYMYLTLNTSEYAKRAVAWDLYEYGNEVLAKISQPSFRFSVTSANFMAVDEFENFKNSIRHGEKLYIEIDEDKVLAPIAIGMKIEYDSPDNLSLEFSDTYTSGDSAFLLADLLEQSVSMGKSLDLSKYTYSAFVDSGASTQVKEFMNTALDVAKNAIISSKDQAITWGESGIRLRKWADEAHTQYDPKQIWMNNNSILMTADNWTTAEIAIGNFYDEKLGDCWGIVAPNIVGTLLAGSNLVIESEKKEGGIAVFKIDSEGCVLHNSEFSITSDTTNTHILLDPEHGIAIGTYPLINSNNEIDKDKCKFWVDGEGNLFFEGTLRATTGEFSGKITAFEGYIGGTEGWTIASTYIYNGKPSYTSGNEGIYIGTDGIALGDTESYIKLGKNGMLAANNATISGTITADLLYANSGGTIGGFEINRSYLAHTKDAYADTQNGVYIGTDGIGLGAGKFYVTDTGFLHAETGEFIGDVKGGTININDNFIVDSDGNVTMKKGSININGKFIVNNDGDTVLNGGSININDNFIVDAYGNVQLNGNITWGVGSSPTQSVYASSALAKPADGTSYTTFPATSSTDWHRVFSTASDYYASYTYDGGKTWTDAIKVVGTDGKNGTNGTDGKDGENGSDANVTDQNVFNALTSNGTMYGCFTNSDKKLFINASYINTGVLTISNSSGTLFTADATKKIVNIAGWKVKPNGLYYTVTNSDGTIKGTGFQPPNSGQWAIAVGYDNESSWENAPFRVSHDGALYATDANISGIINASSGKIGDFNIGTGADGLYTDDMKIVYDHLEFYIDGYTVTLSTSNTINGATEKNKRGFSISGGLLLNGNLQLSTGNSVWVSSYQAQNYSNVFHMDGSNKTLTFKNGLLVAIE